jgi:hypothetical protein
VRVPFLPFPTKTERGATPPAGPRTGSSSMTAVGYESQVGSQSASALSRPELYVQDRRQPSRQRDEVTGELVGEREGHQWCQRAVL